MTQTIVAIFDTSDQALATARALRGAGITRLELMSAEPIHDALPEDEAKSRIGIFAVIGAVIGAASAVLLTVWTSQRVNINTGGMPIVTTWAFGIIAFEVAMLTAILAALIRAIFEARLARGGAMKEYDEAVADNKIVLAVNCKDDSQSDLANSILACHQKMPPHSNDDKTNNAN